MLKRFLLCLAVVWCETAALAREKPNIIVFMVDDMGWMDSAVPFGEKIMARNRQFHTPNMERLAKEGMVFTNAYATPVCTPTRVSLMSGMNAAHHRVTNWTSLTPDTPSDFDSETTALQPPVWNYSGLSPVAGVSHTIHATPLPALIRDAGYFTIHVGKAHFAAAGTPGASPYNLGFLVNVAGNMAGMPQSYYGEENYGNNPGTANWYAIQDLTEYYGTETYLTEALTLEAIKRLEYPVSTEQPFFLYMAHYAVHLPLYEDPRFMQRYYDIGLDSGAAKYASMIEGMDKSLGDLMDFLERKGIADNTVILFMSDNGGHSLSLKKGGALHSHNLPLREGKGSVYEGGIREPMIVKWPGVTQKAARTDTPVIIEDFFPTLLEIAGVSNPALVQEIDGKSFVPVLKGQKDYNAGRALTWHYPNKWKKTDYPDIDYLSAVRQGEWKLVYNMALQKLELYNLTKDIGEQNDVAHKYPEKVAHLAKVMSEKFRAWDAGMPTYKASGKQVLWADELFAVQHK